MIPLPAPDPEWEAHERLVDHDLLERARRDANWHMQMEFKTPEDMAASLPLPVARALSRIYRHSVRGYQARMDDAPLLREYGFVEARGYGVGAYGMKVYRALGGSIEV